MAKKKENKKEDVKEPFDWVTIIDSLEKPLMWKNGLKQYIKDGKEPQSNTELSKLIEDYSTLTL